MHRYDEILIDLAVTVVEKVAECVPCPRMEELGVVPHGKCCAGTYDETVIPSEPDFQEE